MKEDISNITRYEFDLIIQLRIIDPKNYDITYKSISNLLELLKKDE